MSLTFSIGRTVQSMPQYLNDRTLSVQRQARVISWRVISGDHPAHNGAAENRSKIVAWTVHVHHILLSYLWIALFGYNTKKSLKLGAETSDAL